MREDDQFLISPDYLAPRLGMDVETLQAAMQSGEVVSQSESGTGADAGKTRLIMRSNTRVWAAEITADGTAHEIPAPRAVTKAATASSALRERAMQRFKTPATLQKFISYHSQIYNHFNHERHLETRQTYKQKRSAALVEWYQLFVA
jgi:hypothetical protein